MNFPPYGDARFFVTISNDAEEVASVELIAIPCGMSVAEYAYKIFTSYPEADTGSLWVVDDFGRLDLDFWTKSALKA